MSRFFVLMVLALSSCSEPSITHQVKGYLKRGDAVWLCDVDTTGGAVRYRAKQMLTTNAVATKFTAGAFLPVSGPAIKRGMKYGDEALVFFSPRTPASADFILILHGGQTFDGLTRDALVRLIHNAEE